MLKEKKALLLALVFMSTFALTLNSIAQNYNPRYTLSGRYPKGKIFLNTGEIIEGKNLVLQGESASMQVGGMPFSYQISEIRNIMVKKGHAKIFATSCGGGCLGLFLLAYAGGAYEDYYYGTEGLVIGFAFWTAASAGIGYFIGYVTDDWTVIYSAPASYRHDLGKTKNEFKLALLKCKF